MSDCVLLFGRPGSGKGCQAMALQGYGYGYVGTGETFRKISEDAQGGDPMAKYIFDVMNSGNLVEDNVTMDVIKYKLTKDIPVENDFVLDTLRSEVQVQRFYEEIVPRRSIDRVIPVYLHVSREICEKRLHGRAKNAKRPDDEVLQDRLDKYETYSRETLHCLRRMPHFIEINAQMKPVEVGKILNDHLVKFNPSEDFQDHFAGSSSVPPEMEMSAA